MCHSRGKVSQIGSIGRFLAIVGENVMKHLVVLILLNAVVAAQSPKYEWAKKPVKDGVFVHLIDEPVKIYINKGGVHAWGVWVAVDSSSGPAGPSISDIYCTSS